MNTTTRTSSFRRGLVGLGLFAALLFAVLVICAPKAQAYVVDSGNCGAQGDNVKWSLDSDGVLTISGKGEMVDYYGSLEPPWDNYSGKIKKGIIKNGVTYIGQYALSYNGTLTSVTIPKSVTSIGNYAFTNSNSLTSVTIPSNVTSIGGGAFWDCSSLKSVTIPDSVTSIGFSAFEYCTSLTAVKIPNSVTSIENKTFCGCKSLASVTIPKSVTRIGDYAFEFCNNLTSVTIPNSVTSLGEGAFSWCDSLITVKILNPNCELASNAFYRTSTTIHGYEGSTAQAYANETDKKFVALCSHTLGSTVYTKRATPTANGMTYKKCTLCGENVKVSTIPKVSTIKLSKTSYIYIGKARTPTVIIKDSKGNALKKNTDYKVKYASGRTECGKYAVKVVFMGNYAGKKTLKFNIKLGKVTGITQKDTKGIYLTWNKVTGATRYEVWVYKEGYSKPKCVKSSTERWIGNTRIEAGRTLKMQIRAVRVLPDGSETYSAVIYTATAK